MNKKFSFKIDHLFFLFLTLVVILSFRLLQLQLFNQNDFENTIKNNIQDVVNLPAIRGKIYCDDGKKVLAQNKAIFSIHLRPETFPYNIHLRRKNHPEKISNYYRHLQEIEQQFEISTNKINGILRRRRRAFYKDYLLKSYSSVDKILELSSNKLSYPGLFYTFDLRRKYYEGIKYSHIIGYVGKPNNRQLKKNKSLYKDFFYGKLGIEKYYDKELRGKPGQKTLIRDSRNKIRDDFFSYRKKRPISGDDIYLTIDSKVQDILYQVMQGYKGGAIVSEVKSGKVLGLYSYPSYENDLFNKKLSKEIKSEYLYYQTNKDKVFFNRVTHGIYPPSSTFKIVMSCIALKNNISFYKTFYCNKTFSIGNQKFKCEGLHKNVSMINAFAYSCNSYYYQLGLLLGPSKIENFCKEYFNLGLSTDMGLYGEKEGFVPSINWKLEKKGYYWWDGDTANFSIGQGFLALTIAQVHLVTSTIANDGIGYKLHLLDKRFSSVDKIEQKTRKEMSVRLPLKKSSIKNIQKAMRQVLLWGTARYFNSSKMRIYGKTGTAQEKIDKDPHAWFTCYGERKGRKLAVTVFLENAGHGGTIAAPFAISILESIFFNRNPLLIIKEKMQVIDKPIIQEVYKKWRKIKGQKKLSKEYIASLKTRK